MRLTHFGGSALPTASEEINIEFEGRNALVNLRDGSFDADGNAMPAMPTTHTRSFKITTSIDATIDGLMKVFRQGRKTLKGILRDGTTYRQTQAKAINVSRPRNAQAVNYSEMRVTFLQDYPYWTATADEPFYLDNGELLDAGLFLDGNVTYGTITTTSGSVSINNTGGAAIPKGRVLFIPQSGGTIVNPRVTNSANQMYVQYSGTVAYPSRLTVDLLAKSMRLDSTEVYGGVVIPADQMDWMTVELGDNPIAITSASVAGTVIFEWHWVRHYS